jgi:membrane protease subunit HflK
MAWDWEKLQQQRQRKTGGPPPQMGEVFSKIKGLKGRFPGMWIVIIAIPTPPGLNFKLPRGVEKVTKVKVRRVYKEEFGFRTLKAGGRTRYAAGSAYLNESLIEPDTPQGLPTSTNH